MGISKWHRARGEYHLQVAHHLQKTDFPDWALVALYYSALQYVDAVLANNPDLPKDERHPRKHSGIEVGSRGRNQLVAATMPPQVRRAYRSLEELSRRTRYDAEKLSGAASVFEKAMPDHQQVVNYSKMMATVWPDLPSDAS